jgi:hypothetical protein
MFNTVPDVPINTILPEPNAITRVETLLELNIPVVSVNPARFSVPLSIVKVLLSSRVRSLPNVIETVSLSLIKNVTEQDKVTPLVVTVLSPVRVRLRNVKSPVALHIVPATRDILPYAVIVPVLAKVTVPAETVMSKQVNAPVKVTV